MNTAESKRVEDFLCKWLGSEGNERAAEWPEADYIVSNPPFLGKLYLLERLGEGYVKALRDSYKGKVNDSCDFVMYWWYVASKLISEGKVIQFGFVTTNSITQTFNRRIITDAFNANPPIHLIFAIPDHPWTDSNDCADVRIAMTAGRQGKDIGRLETVISENNDSENEFNNIEFTKKLG
jgi:hypothetical protein